MTVTLVLVPYAVGALYHDGIGHAGDGVAEAEERAEGADSGEHRCRVGAGGVGLDAADGFVAGFDVHACGFVVDCCGHLLSRFLLIFFIYPTHLRALSNMRCQGLFVRVRVQVCCAPRQTRSGCGMTMSARPSSLLRPAVPPMEPLGLRGYCSVMRP